MKNFEEIVLPVQKELVCVEALIKKEVVSRQGLLSKMARYLLNSKGKLLRPILVLLSSRALGARDTAKSIKAAAAIELIHTATLVHDDIIDKAKFRRKKKTINTRWGSSNAILFGDYLYSASFNLLSGIGSISLLKQIVDVARSICEGEVNQIASAYKFITEKKYEEIIANKTASLFEASCVAGAVCGSGSEEEKRVLAKYGYNLGMAFQIIDDCIDISGNETNFGKTTGRDLREGKFTLPFILCRKDLGNGSFPKSIEKARKIVFETGAMERAVAKAEDFIKKAQDALGSLGDSVYKNSLHDLAGFVVNRVDFLKNPSR